MAGKYIVDGIVIGAASVNGIQADNSGNVALTDEDIPSGGGTVAEALSDLADDLAGKADTAAHPTVVQATGTSTTAVMSQKAVTDALATLTGAGIEFQIVASLPSTGTSSVIYLVDNGAGSYDEYVWIESLSSFEKLGSTDVDLTGYMHSSTVVGVEKVSSYPATPTVGVHYVVV